MKKFVKGRFSEKEKFIISRELRNGTSYSDIAQLLNRSPHSIRTYTRVPHKGKPFAFNPNLILIGLLLLLFIVNASYFWSFYGK